MPRTSPPRQKNLRSAWTKDLIQALDVAVAEYDGYAGRGKWKAIAAQVPGRNNAQCRQRWENSAKPGRKEGRWSKTEDNALRRAVEGAKHVTWGRWTIVANAIPGRSAKQCAYRYKNHLAPKSVSGDLSATMLQPHSAPNRFLMPALMPSYVDAGATESLMAAIQQLQPLLTKSAVGDCPGHVLDLAVQCLAAHPAETIALIGEVQKLRYYFDSSSKKDWGQPATFGTGASESANGIRVMAAIAPVYAHYQ